MSVNGRAEHHGSNYEEDYFTDVIGRKAEAFLDDHFRSSSESGQHRKPFLMVLSVTAPQEPLTPAPQYANRYSDQRVPRTPSFNYVEDPVRQKHWFMNSEER